jgi:anti-sigma regulatory factor (Ser/Thr protein kinase)
MGIHLVRSFMDDLTYRRENGRNYVTMTKRISGGPAA